MQGDPEVRRRQECQAHKCAGMLRKWRKDGVALSYLNMKGGFSYGSLLAYHEMEQLRVFIGPPTPKAHHLSQFRFPFPTVSKHYL